MPIVYFFLPLMRQLLARVAGLPKLHIFATFLVAYMAFGAVISGIGTSLAHYINIFNIFGFFGIGPSSIHVALFVAWPALFWLLSEDWTLAALALLVGISTYLTYLQCAFRAAERNRLALEEKVNVLRLEVEHYTALPGYTGPSAQPGLMGFAGPQAAAVTTNAVSG